MGMKQCITLSLPKQWPVDKLGCRAHIHHPHTSFSVSSFSRGGVHPCLKSHYVTPSTNAILRRKRSCEFFPASDFTCFHPHSLIPRLCWRTRCRYTILSHHQIPHASQKAPLKMLPQSFCSCWPVMSCFRDGMCRIKVWASPLFKATTRLNSIQCTF